MDQQALNPEEIIALNEGSRAEELLSNSAFVGFVGALKELYRDQLFATDPKDVEGREELYRRSAVVDELIHILNISATGAINIKEAIDAQNQETN